MIFPVQSSINRCLSTLALLTISMALISAYAGAQTLRSTTGTTLNSAPAYMKAQENALDRGFLNPPPSARLRCYWWWLNGYVTSESIDHDLTEMKAKGYDGVLLFDANGADAENNDPVPSGPTFGSPAWRCL